MNYTQAYQRILADNTMTARRIQWGICRQIRGSRESDYEYLNTIPEGTIVEDCKKDCDCKVGIWVPTNEDKKAEDWVLFDEEGSLVTPFPPARKVVPEKDLAEYRAEVLSGKAKY